MERLILGKLFDVDLSGPVVPLQIQVASSATAAANAVAFPATIASATSFTTGTTPIAVQGMVHYALGGILNQNGTAIVQPFLDMVGKIPVGVASSASCTASTAFAVDGTVGTAAIVQSIGIRIINGNGGAAATLTNPVLVLQSS